MGITFEDGMLGCTAGEVRSNRKGNGGEEKQNKQPKVEGAKMSKTASHTSIALLAMSLGIEKLPAAVLGVLGEVTKKVVRSSVDTETFSGQNNAHINVIDVIDSTGGHKRLREWIDKVETEEVGMYAEEIPEQDPGDVSWGRSEVGVEEEGVGEDIGEGNDDNDDIFDDTLPSLSSTDDTKKERTRPYPSHLPPPQPMVVMKLADVE